MTGILFVCTANVCRSPLAEVIVADALSRHDWLREVPVGSAGVRAVPGDGSCAVVRHTIGADAPLGPALVAHRATLLDAGVIGGASMILTASRSERAAIARLAPDARARTFTLREALDLGSLLPRGRIAGTTADQAPLTAGGHIDALAVALNRLRGTGVVSTRRTLFGTRATGVDIVDGHQLSIRKHRATIAETQAIADELAVMLLKSV